MLDVEVAGLDPLVRATEGMIAAAAAPTPMTVRVVALRPAIVPAVAAPTPAAASTAFDEQPWLFTVSLRM